MDLHKGRIGVFSRGEGKGCTFHIDIPIQGFVVPMSESSPLPSPGRDLNDKDGNHDLDNDVNGGVDENRDGDDEKEADHPDGYVPIRRYTHT